MIEPLEYTGKPNLHLTVMEDHAAIAKAAANRIAERLRAKPDLVIGLATGATMEPVYAELVRMHQQEGLDFSKARFFNLDAYKGIPSTDRNSYDNQLRKLLLNKLNKPGTGVNPDNIHLVQGIGFNPEAYEQEIKKAGGIDIQLLGLGGEGHIGFNEVGSKFDSRTREVKLSERTREDNSMYFTEKNETVPESAYTMGIGTILEAKEIIVLANNPNKAWTIRNLMDARGEKPQELSTLEMAQMNRLAGGKPDLDKMLAFGERYSEGLRKNPDPVGELPARALHAHKNVTLLVDKDAASMTRITDLLNHSSLTPEEANALVESYAPKTLTVKAGGKDHTLLLPAGFDFFDPKVMTLDEKFDPQNQKHVEALGKALETTTDVGVGAHQDDIEIMAGPMVLEATRSQDKKWMTVIVTDGAASKSVLNGVKAKDGQKEYTPREITQLRHREQREAAQAQGVPVIQLKYPSAVVNEHMGKLRKTQASLALGSLFAAMPEMERVFGHNPIDKHTTHLGTLSVQTLALRAAKPPKLKAVYGMEVWGGLTGIPEVMLEQFHVTDEKDMKTIESWIDFFQSQIIGQNRQYSGSTGGRSRGHAGYVTSPHGVNPPAGMVIGLNLTEYTKGAETDMGKVADDILERAKAVKVQFAGQHNMSVTPNLDAGFSGAVLRKSAPDKDSPKIVSH